MSKNEFDSIEYLLYQFQKDVVGKTIPKVQNKIKKIHKDVIDEVVFNPYQPEFYMRREQGGLNDEDNMKVDYIQNGDNFEVTLENITKGNKHYSYADGYASGYIADIIEEGVGYGYGLNSKIGARPFIEATQNTIDLTDYIEKEIEDSLKEWN